jgi:2-(1,2-epoxy-1,2-dihydrophenyl)acetyl-CoA isomerase
MNFVHVTRCASIAVVTLDRPDRLNALDEETRHQLLTCLREVDMESDTAAVVLTGAGRAFCVGQDLQAHTELIDAGTTVRHTYNPLVECLTNMSTPIVAAVNGPAVGAGMGLALCCDAVVMADDAFYSCAFAKVGLVPDTGTSIALVRELGYLRAFEAAITGRKITAAEALKAGLATAVTPAGQALESALEMATTWSQSPKTALALTKLIFRGIDRQVMNDSIAAEADSQGLAANHPDHAEGVTAFTQRRTPNFVQHSDGAALARRK